MPLAKGKRTSSPQTDVPELRSLGPKYDKDLHGRHAAVLLKVLTGDSEMPAKNIAVAGHYGSGKSSVILGVQAGLDEKKFKWVNLSLSSLGIDETNRARVQQDGTLAPLTNLIQKEIVKQLLYRKAPADMPASRYYRIHSFQPVPAALWGLAVAVVFSVVAVLFGLVGRVRKVAPQTLVTNHDAAPWLVVVGLGALLGAAVFFGLRIFQSRFGVESVSAGGAAVKLSAKENSYFDEYLDEIVYFFQKTKTQVAIFEDLDRFEDPHIFETLRELNTVLNNSEQVTSRPVRFVYAVRDSIFEQLEVDTESSDVAAAAPVSRRASMLESAPSANRTKFFDLVVPMVPFITHRSARDLLAAEFEGSDLAPSPALVNLVGAHLTDMRLIRNIRNEFEIYRASILGKDGLKGLTADRLFAMMVYKNLHLEDFEAIRLGTSRIDDAHTAFRAMVEYQTGRQAAKSKAALDQIAADAAWENRAAAAGERLQEVLPIFTRALGRGGDPGVQHGGTNYPHADLTSVDLWKALCKDRGAVQIVQSGFGAISVSFDDLMILIGERADGLDKAVDADMARLQRTSRVALETKEFVSRATMAELMARTDLSMPVDEDTNRNLDSIVGDLVSPLARDLLARGHIDENFTLYCSDYHAIAISVSAMNFILHCVQADRSDYRFRFDDPHSIQAVESEMGARFLDGESVFSIEVFDHYLSEQQEQLNTGFDKLVARIGTDASFTDAYLTDGKAKELFVGQLARRWQGMFVYLIERSPLDKGATVRLVDAALLSAASDVDYETSDEVAAFVSAHFHQMSAFTEAGDAVKANDLAIVLGRLGGQVADLSVLADAQKQAVIAADLYPVTRVNLESALGDVGLALDAIRDASAEIYGHALRNVEDYLAALEPGEKTVESSDAFVSVLDDVTHNAQSAVHAVASGASEFCEVANLEDLDEAAWPAVVSAGRFSSTVWNVSNFVSKVGVSEALIGNLDTLALTNATDVELDLRLDLAGHLLDSEDVSPDTRIRLVEQLELPDGLDPASLTGTGLTLLPALLAANLVPDTAETYVSISERPFALREQYFAASQDLADYVDELPLSSDDLMHIMRSRSVAPAVKRAIADDAEFVNGRISRQGAIAICEWADKGNELSIELLGTLSKAGAPAARILSLLEPHLGTIETQVLDEILVALGDEYEPLTRVGRHRPKLKDREGTNALLSELQQRNRVSSFGPGLLGGIKVNMRH